MASVNTPAVASRQPGSSGWASSIQAKTGTSTIRNAVNALGTFQGLVSATGATGRLADEGGRSLAGELLHEVRGRRPPRLDLLLRMLRPQPGGVGAVLVGVAEH